MTKFRNLLVAAVLVSGTAIAGCSMDQQTGQRTLGGAGVGAAAGATVGLLRGDFLSSTLTGAAAGAAGGFVYDQIKRN
ncbi:MAG: hypothetical protein U1E14_02875 [Geminicoccaceae bacterium]